jgi:hypothetical protein
MSSRWRQIAAVAAAVAAGVAAVAIAGIALGGEESASATRTEYQATVVNTRDRVDYAMLRITKSTSVDELISRIGEASTAVGSAAADLGSAGVADGFGDENEELVRTLQAFSDELANTSAQFEDPSFSGTLPGINSLSFTQWDVVNERLADLRKQGIRVQPLERH